MPTGWIRAYQDVDRQLGFDASRKTVARQRQAFTTPVLDAANDNANTLATLAWGATVDLPDGRSEGPWTRVLVDGHDGFVQSDHVVEIAHVAPRTFPRKDPEYTVWLRSLRDGTTKLTSLLWGDVVQILRRDDERCLVRVRGWTGWLPADRLQPEPLLELYFVDVGQGDGVLVRFPSGRHMLIDGGLPRSNQMTGKNAADFVDWKFFRDYGDHTIRLDAMVASHCDQDHYGGLWDLVRMNAEEDQELDCVDVDIDTFYHPGLSRWDKRSGATPPHRDGLGPNLKHDGAAWFVRLLGDRADVEASIPSGAPERIGGEWREFLDDLVQRNPTTACRRLGAARASLQAGDPLPTMPELDPAVPIRVLAPVTALVNGQPALKDLGVRGKNTNGHSVCLRLDYGAARLLLTGDLNKKSMDWLMECYGHRPADDDNATQTVPDRTDAFACDVAKACHHGSADVSYRFLQKVHAAATIIQSGDAEGHAHPRPEIVGASAVTGYQSIDPESDQMVTPLVYMTEVERSVSLGEVSHIRFRNYPDEQGGDPTDGALFARPIDEVSEQVFPTSRDRRAINRAEDSNEAKRLKREAIARERPRIEALELQQRENLPDGVETSAEYHLRCVHELFSIRYDHRPVAKSRVMMKNHYGLVNVRTDGKTIVCATMKESGEGWTVHAFPARFGQDDDPT